MKKEGEGGRGREAGEGGGTANPVKFITQIWQPDNIQSDFLPSSCFLCHIYIKIYISNYATAQAKVPMRQVTFSSAQS